ncbi:MAG: DNA-processing protein DprA [Lachnospiraceae bacterium]|nr:DNA-processing protein DprA [Lachnospiraceae bacterium]
MNDFTKEKDLLNLWFNNIKGIGALSKRKLRDTLGNVENIYDAPEELVADILDEKRAAIIHTSRNMSNAAEIRDELFEKGIDIVYPGHEDYPQKLLNICDPPDILYIKGILKKKLNIYNMNIGIVGARNASVYGRELAQMFGRELAKNDINIVSGLALGIDGMSHRGALAAGGYTVGVLGCGIDVIYPRENASIYFDIEKNGAIISEYGPGVEPNPGFFPIRNRIISGLSDGLLVVEARKKSGSLITADLALEQGKQVYAVPGRITDKNSEGTNNLISQGAMCVVSPKDILDDLNRITMNGVYEKNYINKKYENNNLSKKENVSYEKFAQDIDAVNKNSLAPAEKMLYSCLSLEPTYIDDIIEKLKIGVSDTISLLYNMEEKGLIKQPLKGYYIISV